MIENSGPSDRTTIGEVSELIHIFPYFQSAYLLLLKGLHNTADVKFENQLRLSAMHIANREILYYLLKKEPEKTSVKEIVTESGGETQVQEQPIMLLNTTDNQQVVIDSAKNSDELINEIEKETKPESTEFNPAPQTVVIADEPGGESDDATIFLIDGESGAVEEKITYMDPGFSIPEQPELLELETDSVESETEKAAGEPKLRKQLQSELIDKFILANPRIEPKKEKTETPNVDISAPYVEERGGFVTETLARIYINQGYYSRAIDIYEKLSLKFPEKSSYFASQIEKVKELLKK